MQRSLATALLASFSLHMGVVVLIPSVHGWGANNSVHSPTMRASLRLPKLTTQTYAPMAREKPLTHNTASSPPPSPGEQDVPASDTNATSGFGLPLPEAPRNYESTELTDRPAALDALPSDLEEQLPAGHSGRAILVLEIDEKGSVVSITPESSDLPAASLEKIAAAFKEMRFLPGKIGKAPVKARMRIELSIDDWRNELAGTTR